MNLSKILISVFLFMSAGSAQAERVVYVVDLAFATNEFTDLTLAYIQGCDDLSDGDSLTIIMKSNHVQNVSMFSPPCNLKLVRGAGALGEVSAQGAGLMLFIGKSFHAVGIKFQHPEKVLLFANGGATQSKLVLEDSTFVAGSATVGIEDYKGTVLMNDVRVLDSHFEDPSIPYVRATAKLALRNVAGGADLRGLRIQGRIEIAKSRRVKIFGTLVTAGSNSYSLLDIADSSSVEAEECSFSSAVAGSAGVSVNGTGESGSAGYSFLKLSKSALDGVVSIGENGYADISGVTFRSTPAGLENRLKDSNWGTGGLISNPVGNNPGLTNENVSSRVDFDGNGCADFPKSNNKKNSDNQCGLDGKSIPSVPGL